MAFIRINHDEDTGEYHNVELKFHDGSLNKEDERTWIYRSGDAEIDWYHMTKDLVKEVDDRDVHPATSMSSSVDHFVGDNQDYKWAVLDLRGEKPELVQDYGPDHVEGCMSMIVHRDFRGTWEDLKERCEEYDPRDEGGEG